MKTLFNRRYILPFLIMVLIGLDWLRHVAVWVEPRIRQKLLEYQVTSKPLPPNVVSLLLISKQR